MGTEEISQIYVIGTEHLMHMLQLQNKINIIYMLWVQNKYYILYDIDIQHVMHMLQVQNKYYVNIIGTEQII